MTPNVHRDVTELTFLNGSLCRWVPAEESGSNSHSFPSLKGMALDYTGKSFLTDTRWLCPSMSPEASLLLLFGLRRFEVFCLLHQSEHVEGVRGQKTRKVGEERPGML